VISDEQTPKKRLKKAVKSSATIFNSGTEITINSEKIPTINEQLSVANITKARNFLFQLQSADKRINRYSLFGPIAIKSIDLIFRNRAETNHSDMGNEEFFDIILETLNPIYVKEDADFLRLAEAVDWKIDLEKGAGLDLIPKLESIVSWEVKWARMNRQKRKDALTYIMKQIGSHLRVEYGSNDILYSRLLREKLISDNKEFSMDLFLNHVYVANSEWKRIKSCIKPPTTEEIEYWGINKTPKGEQKPQQKSTTPTTPTETSKRRRRRRRDGQLTLRLSGDLDAEYVDEGIPSWRGSHAS
jgi:hypothetical protein